MLAGAGAGLVQRYDFASAFAAAKIGLASLGKSSGIKGAAALFFTEAAARG